MSWRCRRSRSVYCRARSSSPLRRRNCRSASPSTGSVPRPACWPVPPLRCSVACCSPQPDRARSVAARVLLGIGCCSSFMAPLAIYARRFPPERFGLLTGVHVGIGSIGTLIATAPLAFAAATDRVAQQLPHRRGRYLRASPRGRRCGAATRRTRSSAPRRRRRLRQASSASSRCCAFPPCARLFLMHLTGYSSFAAGGRPVGRPLPHPCLRLRPQRTWRRCCSFRRSRRSSASFVWGPMDRLFGSLQAAGDDRRRADGGVACGDRRSLGTLPAPMLVALVRRVRVLHRLHAGDDRARQIVVPAAPARSRHHLLNLGTMGGVFLVQTVSGVVRRSLSHRRRRISARCLSPAVRLAGGRCPSSPAVLSRRLRSAAPAPAVQCVS